MSVIEQIVVESRRYSGWIDQRYPIGYWQAVLTATGNASGGVLGVDLVFQGAVPAFLNSQLYSVERFGIQISDGANRVNRVAAVNMGGPANQGFVHQYSIASDGQSAGGQSAIRGDQLSMLPWFLGSQRTPGIVASLSTQVVNLNGLLLTFEAEGYRWSARSVLVDGGPQRPPTGPYKA